MQQFFLCFYFINLKFKKWGKNVNIKINSLINNSTNSPIYIIKERKKEIRSLVKDFCKQKKFSEGGRNSFGRIEHITAGLGCSLWCTISGVINKNVSELALGIPCIFINLGLDKTFHNIALRKSLIMRRFLKQKGIRNNEDLSYAINIYLKKRGGVLYSNLFRLFNQDKIKKMASDGHLPKLKGLVYKIQVKDGGLTSYLIPAVKRKKFLKKLKGVFGLTKKSEIVPIRDYSLRELCSLSPCKD